MVDPRSVRLHLLLLRRVSGTPRPHSRPTARRPWGETAGEAPHAWPPWVRTGLAASDHRDHAGHPLVVGDAVGAALESAVGRGGLPEPNLVEVAQAVDVTALVGEQRIALAGRKHHPHRSEPGSQV